MPAALSRAQQYKAEQRKQDLRQQTQAEIDRDRGGAPRRRVEAALQQTRAHDLAADLRGGQASC